FMVIATQNPIEMEGTFPLPEAQLDRFLAKIVVEEPSVDELVEIMRRYHDIVSAKLSPVLLPSDVVEAIEAVKRVYVESNVMKYMAYIVDDIRRNPLVRLGPSPRGALALYLLSKSVAFMRGRDYVIPDDVKYVAMPALRHRIVLRPEARLSGRAPEDVISEALSRVEPP
ncbi:MAG: MoxR family ATPase, partial [Crenarchaeota archaeon]|nr:MoxR family ATPase [Thermoproteota archaeon]